MRRRLRCSLWIASLAFSAGLLACSDDSGGGGGNADGKTATYDGGSNGGGDSGSSSASETTIYKIKKGDHKDGDKLILPDVIVTAVDEYGKTGKNDVYVQEAKGGKQSGIKLFGPKLSGGTVGDLKPGDHVKVAGTLDYWSGPKSSSFKTPLKELTGAIVTKLKGGTAPSPADLTVAQMTSSTTAAEWEGVLVRIKDTKVTKGLDTQYGSFEVGGKLTVDDELYAYKPKVGDCLSITGILVYFYFHQLAPRAAGDVVTSTSCPATKSVKISDIQDTSSSNHPKDGAWVKVSGVVTALDSTPDKNGVHYGFWIQEEGAGGPYKGIQVYHTYKTTETLKPPALGNVAEVTGQYTEFKGLSEIKTVTQITDKGKATTVPQAVSVSATDIQTGGAKYEQYEGVLVKVASVKVASILKGTTSGTPYAFKVEGAKLEVANDLYDFLSPPPKTGTVYTQITGVLNWRSSKAQLLPRSAADVSK